MNSGKMISGYELLFFGQHPILHETGGPSHHSPLMDHLNVIDLQNQILQSLWRGQ